MALIEFQNNSAPYLNAENLNNNFNELKTILITRKYTIPIGTISSQDGKYDQEFNLETINNYKPMGIVGVNTTGPYSASLTIPKIYINNNKILYSVFNSSTTNTTDLTTSIEVTILFMTEF